jgi:hypothetical protein
VDTPESPSGWPSEGPSPSPPESQQQPQSQAQPTTGLSVSQAVAVPAPSGPPSPTYPASFEITYPSELNRWLPLIKWLLVIPHLIAPIFDGIGAFSLLVYRFFAVLFTGRWQRGAFDYFVGTLRWVGLPGDRLLHLMTDAYPSFSLVS